eukprot:CAMPEP_0195126978 /NCGR_PEP_ID=MMETSP0448-20130528/136056_1 /TAXON_ID=66468 /ORGANISM="Heterocapsa triquestra, Strain CCMP 448" /LENGTH=50 /DNA_ID=CAMNT_0040164687 /DNA_START=33 /DNA_END=182 /DNA_ORIENTATION=-
MSARAVGERASGTASRYAGGGRRQPIAALSSPATLRRSSHGARPSGRKVI